MRTDQWNCFSRGDQKMAESKGSLIAKSVSKHAGRAKEKVCMLFNIFYNYSICLKLHFQIVVFFLNGVLF